MGALYAIPGEVHATTASAGPSNLRTGSKAFSSTPVTMIAVGMVGLILFFFFTANHPKKRAHSLLLEAGLSMWNAYCRRSEN